MSEHTPGPWEAVAVDAGHYVVWDSQGNVLGRRLYPEDARLIAAAPELLAALERVVYDLEPYVTASHLQPARAAIAKARGKA